MNGHLIAADERNAQVLFQYVNGQDLNSRPDCSGSRWIINFNDLSEGEAKAYPELYSQVLREVKPEREKNNDKRVAALWWKYRRPSSEMYYAITGLGRVIALTRVSRTVMPVMVPTGQVLSAELIVFASDDTGMLALLSCAPHYWWAISRSSTMKGDLRYACSDVFETMPRPGLTVEMRELGNRLDVFRRNLMLSRQAGLTDTYKLVHNPSCADADIAELRDIHCAIDEAVVRAYGWSDLLEAGLDLGFHDTRQGIRFTIGPMVRQEILDRLLELNHARYAEEVKAGLHAKKPSRKRPSKESEGQQTLLDM